MIPRARVVAAALVACTSLECGTQETAFHREAPGESGKETRFAVIAYTGAREELSGTIPAGKLTQCIYSFLHIRGDTLALDARRDSAAIARLVALKRDHTHLKILLSLGGWGGCRTCSDAFASAPGRAAFARSAKAMLERTGADGIDIDWEYPAIEGYPGHRFTPEDRHNFTLLIEELRTVLGSRDEISFAAGGFTECILSSYEWGKLIPLVDRVNVMTYDLVNANSTVTGHLTPLRSCPGQQESCEHAVHLLDSLGVPRGKIVIGAAFYGRIWGGVQDTNHGLFQPGKFLRYVRYSDLDGFFSDAGGFTAHWDSTAEAPYAYSPPARMFATYDDARSVALKTAYARRNRLGGIMFWELSGDLPAGGLLDAIDSVRTAEK